MLDPRFVLLGALLGLVGSCRYSWLTLQGRTRPNRVTWVLWATAPTIGFLAQLDEGVGLPAVLTLSVGVGPALIVAASFANRSSYWRVGRFDLGCGAVSAVALAVWVALDDPVTAVVLAVLADAVAGIPTLVKAWRYPWTESPVVFVFTGLNGVIALLTIRHWDVATWAFPVYITLLGAGAAALVVARQRAVGAPSTGGATSSGGATSTSDP